VRRRHRREAIRRLADAQHVIQHVTPGVGQVIVEFVASGKTVVSHEWHQAKLIHHPQRTMWELAKDGAEGLHEAQHDPSVQQNQEHSCSRN
jgi:hypothetical protein